VVAHLVRLKLSLLRNSLRRDVWRLVGTLLALAWGLLAGLVVAAGLVLLRGVGTELAGAAVTVGGGLLLAGWVLVPLLAFGVDETLDPARFATLPLRQRELVPGLLLAGLVGVPGLVTAVVALATVATWSRGVVPAAVACAAAVLATLTCVAASRAATAAASGLLTSRRTREVGASVGVLVVMFAGLGPTLLRDSGFDVLGSLPAVAEVLGWTPLGWLWSAPWDAAEGRAGAAALKLLLGSVLLVALLRGWGLALDRALVRPRGGGGGTVHGPGLLDRADHGPVGAVAVRCLRYWRRDPRYLTSVVATAAFPLLFAVLVAGDVMSVGTAALMVGPVIAGSVGWGQHNDVAYDGSAVWTHVAAGVPGVVDRRGRLVALLVWALPLALTATVAGTLVAGRGGLLPACLGLSVALLGAGCGVSAVASALAPYPVPEAGSNPFSQPPGSGGQTILAQLATSTATVVLGLPTGLAFLLALRGGGPATAWVALLVGVATGVAAVLAGVRLGGRVFDRRAPELLQAVRR
jgi:ABC-2 type transport system permease protein